MEVRISKHRLGIAAGVGVVALGLAAGAAVMSPGQRAPRGGETLKIALFTPPPPPIEVGEVMDVGEMTDGYVHHPVPKPEPIEWVEFEEGWWDVPTPEAPRQVSYVRSDPDPIPVEAPRPADRGGDRMGLGFDSRAESERRVMRSAPPERQPGTPPPTSAQQGDRPAPVAVTGERLALFY